MTTKMTATNQVLADYVRHEIETGKRLIYVNIDGNEALVLAWTLGQDWLSRATDEDIRRIAVY